MARGGDFVDERAFVLGQHPAVALLVFFFELFEHLPLFHGLDQRLAFLSDLALGARHALLVSVDVAAQALKVGFVQQHVRASKTLVLFAALFLQTLPAGVLLFSQCGLFIGESAACFGKLLLEAFLGVPSGCQQCFEAERWHGSVRKR